MKILNRIYNPINVEYMGVFMPIPPGVKFLATDSFGELYGFIVKPRETVTGWCFQSGLVRLAKVDLEGKDWRESLVAL